MDRHPTALGRRLDLYLAAVAAELAAHGVVTGAPQRSDPAGRLLGSIVVDTTALRPDDGPPAGALPVLVTWDESTGWCAALHHDPGTSSRRYLHPDLLPSPAVVAEFVVGLALGRSPGSERPIGPPVPYPPRLHLVPGPDPERVP